MRRCTHSLYFLFPSHPDNVFELPDIWISLPSPLNFRIIQYRMGGWWWVAALSLCRLMFLTLSKVKYPSSFDVLPWNPSPVLVSLWEALGDHMSTRAHFLAMYMPRMERVVCFHALVCLCMCEGMCVHAATEVALLYSSCGKMGIWKALEGLTALGVWVSKRKCP